MRRHTDRIAPSTKARFLRRVSVVVGVSLVLISVPAGAGAGSDKAERAFMPGAAGAGDPYYPLDGNGGYDVGHYALDITYDPATDVLFGVATITATATQNLSSFNLDLQGLTVRSIKVNGSRATFSREGSELTVVPNRGLRKSSTFIVVVRYDGVPEPVADPLFGGISGFIATDDGALVAGEPHVAATWYPVNDHPSDAASYTFEITVPEGLEAVANGVLSSTRTRHGWTTWKWIAKEPMASYLVTATIGQFDLRAYKANDIKFWDAIDPDLFIPPVAPHGGTQVAISQAADASYKRLTHTITVPSGGANLTFWVARDTEPNWDYFFVEAHTVGLNDWTTLPEASGITSTDTGFSCPNKWAEIHPFLSNYQTDNGDGTCSPVGTPPATGTWNAVTGTDPNWVQWTIDLKAYAGKSVEISLAYASDNNAQGHGVAIDDVVVSTGEGTTGFENDGNVFDGWTATGPPAGSPGNLNNWTFGTQADLPPAQSVYIEGAFARQPEIISFLSGFFGRYPFSAGGGIVDDLQGLGFSLENQTRPIYSRDFFSNPIDAQFVVVHELAHQWMGDSVRLARWQDIWLNEGFATYAEWLWGEQQGFGTTQQNFDFYATAIPPEDPFWTVTIGDPGTDKQFDFSVYARGAMTLQALRTTVGDENFFKILRTWAKRQAGKAVVTSQFIDLAESISGQDLGALFDTWLYTAAKPDIAAIAATTRFAVSSTPTIPAAARSEMSRYAVLHSVSP
ncbi:MAG: hypothetical protein QOE09_3489 [Ilumatobacteraceae bacterium]